MQHVQLLVPCLVAVFSISLMVITYIYKMNIADQIGNQDVADHILIGILSARENFAQRNSIRKTWVRFLQQNNDNRKKRYRISHRFIVGSRSCEIPSEDRISEFSCKWDAYIGSYQDHDIFAYKIDKDSKFVSDNLPIGLDFEVLHPIIVSKLGVTASSSKKGFPIKVALFDRTTKTEVVFANFNKSDSVINGFLVKDVDNYLLPKEFKGSLVVDSFGQDFLYAQANGPCNINDGGGLLKFFKLTRHGPISGYFPDKVVEQNTYCSLVAGTFVFKPKVDDDSRQRNISTKAVERKKRLTLWEEKLQRDQQLLVEETKKHNDILIVDVKDYYRNIPKKLLMFYKWASSQNGLHFTIKTDDDCYVNIPKTLQEISSMNLRSKDSLWYGSFRFDWPVDLFGKWAENEYPSSVYPAFACGSGNLVSKYVVDWIALNSNFLHGYQGEDVSMAIWLSAILPKIINDNRWSCFKICDKSMLSLPNNSPEEIASLYENHLNCSNPCGCTS